MASTIFFSQNYFNEFQFPDHTISENNAATGNEAWRVANGRRAEGDKWLGATNGVEWIKVDAGSGNTLSPTMIAIDRGHNLGGQAIKLQYSTDNSSWSDEWSVTVPTASSAGTAIDATNGCLTEEGAWIYKFANDGGAKRYWRLYIAAISAFAADIVGLYLGTYFEPASPPDKPFAAESGHMGFQETMSDHGWSGTTPSWDRLQGTVTLRLASTDEANARSHIVTPFCRQGRLMWIVPDKSAAEQSFLAEQPSGAFFYGYRDDWGHRTLEFGYREKEPKLR